MKAPPSSAKGDGISPTDRRSRGRSSGQVSRMIAAEVAPFRYRPQPPLNYRRCVEPVPFGDESSGQQFDWEFGRIVEDDRAVTLVELGALDHVSPVLLGDDDVAV